MPLATLTVSTRTKGLCSKTKNNMGGSLKHNITMVSGKTRTNRKALLAIQPFRVPRGSQAVDFQGNHGTLNRK